MMDKQSAVPSVIRRRALPRHRPGHRRTEGRARVPRRRGPSPRGPPRRDPRSATTAPRPRTPNEWWAIDHAARQRLVAADAGARARVRAVAVTGLYASTVPVDADGEPTGPCLTWLDTRGALRAARRRRTVPGLQPAQGTALRAKDRRRAVDGGSRSRRPDPVSRARANPRWSRGRGGSWSPSTTSPCASPESRRRRTPRASRCG